MKKQIAALATDENNIVMWNINALLADYKNAPYITVETCKLVPREWLSIDREYALTTNLDIPIILFELPNDLLYIADGNHRLYRAITEKIDYIKAIVVPQEKHLTYLYLSTEEAYYRVIDGLKDEGIFIDNII